VRRALVLVVFACNDTNTGITGDSCGTGAVTLDQLPACAAHILCTQIFACCDANEVAAAVGYPVVSETDCEDQYRQAIARGTPEIQTAITDRYVVYDADAAGTCLATIAAEACGDFSQTLLAQLHPTEASVNLGCSPPFLIGQLSSLQILKPGECSADYECMSQYCLLPYGVCGPIPGDGGQCDDACVSGLVCVRDLGVGTCRPQLGTGARCRTNNECASGHCIGGGWCGRPLCAAPPRSRP
jgi:hypothetical protein